MLKLCMKLVLVVSVFLIPQTGTCQILPATGSGGPEQSVSRPFRNHYIEYALGKELGAPKILDVSARAVINSQRIKYPDIRDYVLSTSGNKVEKKTQADDNQLYRMNLPVTPAVNPAAVALTVAKPDGKGGSVVSYEHVVPLVYFAEVEPSESIAEIRAEKTGDRVDVRIYVAINNPWDVVNIALVQIRKNDGTWTFVGSPSAPKYSVMYQLISVTVDAKSYLDEDGLLTVQIYGGDRISVEPVPK